MTEICEDCGVRKVFHAPDGMSAVSCKKFKAKSEICECFESEYIVTQYGVKCIRCNKFKAKNHSPLTNPELDSVSRIDEDTLRGSVKKDCTNCKEHIEKWLKGEAAPFICELCGATYDEVYKGSDNIKKESANKNV